MTTKFNRWRNAGVIVTMSALTLTMAACSGSDAEPDASGGGTAVASGDGTSGEVTFAYLGDASQQDAFEAMFSVFNEQYPDIKLNAQGIPSGDWATFSNTVATRLAGGEKIDIIQIATEGQRLFASKGLLEPLEPYFERDQEFVDDYFDDISPRLAQFNETYASDPDGNVVFVPGGFNTVGMYLNKQVFDESGVEIPADGNWTWDEFVEAGETIKAKTGAYLVSSDAPSGYFTGVMPWLTTNGASTFDDTWTTPTFDSPAAVEAAEFARSLVEMGLSPEPGGQFDMYTQFAQGNLAVIQGGRWPTINLREVDMVDSTVFVQTPTNVSNGSPVGWDAWNITKESENKEAAWTFIKFLMSTEAGEYFATVGGTIVPARESVAASAAFTDNAPEFSTRLSEAMDFATAIPSPDRGAEVQKVIEEAWLTILTGNGDAQETLSKAQQELTALVND